jgi:hypothetical protein
MEIISKISKGSRMDQVYIPKRRLGFEIGSHVIIKPLQELEKHIEKPFFYNINFLEPIKVNIINEIFENIDKIFKTYDNIIITGSFLEKGFHFNDIDVLIVMDDHIDEKYLEELVENKLGIKPHIILINNKSLIKGLNTDPLYQTMLSKCVSRKRFIYKTKHEINYKILDLHLLKSKLFVENFNMLNGNEKYEMLRNVVSISLFLDKKEVSKNKVDKEIAKLFGKNTYKEIKDNIISDKSKFLRRYKKLYKKLERRILRGIKSGSK